MTKELKTIDATCPNCNTEMSVELPEGVTFKDPRIDEEEWSKFIKTSEIKSQYEFLLEKLRDIRFELVGSWRNKKARKLVEDKILKHETYLQIVRDQHYHLYNKLNPPVGEMSTD